MSCMSPLLKHFNWIIEVRGSEKRHWQLTRWGGEREEFMRLVDGSARQFCNVRIIPPTD